ncbi:MAG TPA: Pvc16 family protein [Candidatus Thermoplasmatota archaeon]|nr:Pvc16 family protein [Candidatus Thermoplasmatota archaeon]
MSDYRSIAGVTATLRALLEDRMELPPDLSKADKFRVSTRPLRPDKADEPAEDPRINLFLYRVTENVFLKNQEIPGHGSPGAYGRPPLSLNLHYLLTPHGTDGTGETYTELPGHILLGSAMRVLHDHPVVTEATLRVTDPVGDAILDRSLHGQFERIKVTLEPLEMEDLTKVFTALTAPYRLCASYVATVVQIESTRQRSFPRPVREPPAGPQVAVLPFRSPTIEEVRVRREGDPPGQERPYAHARVGDTLVLLGSGFASTSTRVAFGALRVAPSMLRETRIEVALPDDPALQPGARDVAVVVGAQGPSAPGFRSNAAAFLLAPRLLGAARQPTTQPRSLLLTGRRLWADGLPGETVAGRAVVPRALYLPPPAPAQVAVPLPDSLPAFPVRCVVSGASPTFPLPPNPVMGARVGNGASKPVHLAPAPGTLEETAAPLQDGLRAAPAPPALAKARVAAADGRLIVVPAGLSEGTAITFQEEGDGTATKLKLLPGTAHTPYAYLSGALSPFPSLAAAAPEVKLNGTVVSLGARPATIDAAAAALQAAIRGALGLPKAIVAALGDQLLFVLDPDADLAPDPVQFGATDGDPVTVTELALVARLPLRVRVNGAESIDDVEVVLP